MLNFNCLELNMPNKINLEELYSNTDVMFEYMVSNDLMGKMKQDQFVQFEWSSYDYGLQKEVDNFITMAPIGFENFIKLMKNSGMKDHDIKSLMSGEYWGYKEEDIDSWQHYETRGNYFSEKNWIFFNRKTNQCLQLFHLRKW